MSAIYSIFTSPHHPAVPDHLPTLIVTPHGRPSQILYTYLHTNRNLENYLLTPSEAGDLCVAKLFPPDHTGGVRSAASSASHGSGGPSNYVRCEASRNLRWNISQTGIQNPIYKLTLPNPESPAEDQPLFQVSKPNPNATWWTIFYFAYAGHLIPPKRIEFGRIQKNPPEAGGGTRVAIMGKSDEEKAVWRTLGEGNEDMVEWIVVCAALVVLDDEIISAAEKAGLGAKMRAGASGGYGAGSVPPSPQKQRTAPPPQLQGSPVRYALQDQPRSATAPPGHGGQPEGHSQMQTQRMPPPQQPQFGGKDSRMMQQQGYPHQRQQRQRGPPPPDHHHQQQHFPDAGPSDSPAPHRQPPSRYPTQSYGDPPQQQLPYPGQPPAQRQQQQQYQQEQQQQQQQQYPQPSQQPHPTLRPHQRQQPPSTESRQPSSYRPGPPRPGAGLGMGAQEAGRDWRV
ncbi:hypothetical protein JCM11251_002286 [Rhodosporidiobolus azoricus]